MASKLLKCWKSIHTHGLIHRTIQFFISIWNFLRIDFIRLAKRATFIFFVIRFSFFFICYSSFIICHSSFVICHSLFVFRYSVFVICNSLFVECAIVIFDGFNFETILTFQIKMARLDKYFVLLLGTFMGWKNILQWND